jgi:hypothetical protein
MSRTARLSIAVLIAAVIYGAGLGVGSLLYATGAIATGATRRPRVSGRRSPRSGGIDEGRAAGWIKARRRRVCGHELTEEVFRSEYLFWPVWPAAICAVIFLLWPAWSLQPGERRAACEHMGTTNQQEMSRGGRDRRTRRLSAKSRNAIWDCLRTELLKTNARDFLEKECPETLVRDGRGTRRAIRRPVKMADQGWQGLLIPSSSGGAASATWT